MKSDLVDIEIKVHAVTDKAVLVSEDGERESAVWLPLSQIELEEEARIGRLQVITMPEWLAVEKGLA